VILAPVWLVSLVADKKFVLQWTGNLWGDIMAWPKKFVFWPIFLLIEDRISTAHTACTSTDAKTRQNDNTLF
jgi:hypothetical protein